MKPLFAFLVPFLLSACSAERMIVIKDRAETTRLGESAELYWHAMRWGDHPAASAFIEDLDARFAWLERVTEVRVRHYRSAEVLNVTAGPLLEADPRGIQREGVVIAKVAYYAMPSQVLKADMVKQEWYRAESGWFLSAEQAQ
jgi:hypothetical protein